MSWLTFVLLALVLIFAVQGFRKGMLRMAISMVFFLMVLGVTSWLNPYISDFVREKTTWQISIWVIFLIITIICDTPAGIYLQGQIRSDPILTWIYDNNMLMKIVLQIFG